jgi:hypothetical protein
MAVKKRDLPAQNRQEEAAPHYAPPRDTGMVEAETVARGAIPLVRLTALLLWFSSLFGTYVPFVGGWAAFTAQPWPPSLLALGGAALLQAAFTWAQWSFKARAVLWWRAQQRYGGIAARASAGWWLAYAIALVISAGFSTVTYGQWLTPALAALGGPWWAGWIVVGIAAILADMLPEWVIMRD